MDLATTRSYPMTTDYSRPAMPSINLHRSVRTILMRRALARRSAKERANNMDNKLGRIRTPMSSSDDHQFIEEVNERSCCDGHSIFAFELLERSHRYIIERRKYKWRVSWDYKQDDTQPSSLVLNIEHIDPIRSEYEVRFHVVLKNYGFLMYKKEFVSVQKYPEQKFVIQCDCDENHFPSNMSWSDVTVSVEMIFAKMCNMWMDEEHSEVSFLSPNRAHDAILVIDEHRFHVKSVYMAAWSRHLDRLFFGRLGGANRQQMELHGIDPMQFLDLLQLIHPMRSSGINEQNIEYLLALGDYLYMPTVLAMCSEWLSDFKNKRSWPVMDRIEIADEYGLMGLLNVCCKHLLANNDVLTDFLTKNQNRIKELSESSQTLVRTAMTSKDPNSWY